MIRGQRLNTVKINGVGYKSLRQASSELGIGFSTLLARNKELRESGKKKIVSSVYVKKEITIETIENTSREPKKIMHFKHKDGILCGTKFLHKTKNITDDISKVDCKRCENILKAENCKKVDETEKFREYFRSKGLL